MAFYDDTQSHSNIVIAFTGSPRYDFGAFARGYHQAANQLSKNLLCKSGYRDFDGYPIVFLYRHAFELNLKNIAYWSMRLCAFKNIDLMDAKLHHNHDLIQLADLGTRLLLKLFATEPGIDKLVGAIKTIAREFHEIDSTSFSYRYPIDKSGNYSTKEHQVVNILSIHRNMDKLLNDLEIVNFGLDIDTDQAQEVYELLNDYSLN
jgi:hypothetical protein